MRKFNKYKNKLISKIVIIITLIIAMLILITIKLTSTIDKKCKFEINKFVIENINKAVGEAINQYGYNYDDYIKIQTANDGSILAIFTNAKQMNLIQTAITKKVNETIQKFSYRNIYIPVGSLTGLVWFSSRGPNLPIKIASDGYFSSDIESSMESAGVNQTLHKLYIKINANIIGFLPFHSIKVNINSKSMLSESLIVGKVPNSYAKFN